jgi:glycerate 2-kinase
LLSGESREVGRALCCVAREVALSGHPAKAPCALIATGETAVRIAGETHGSGGANQELAAGACLDLAPTDPIAVCALDTDGSDGPGIIAGALTDGTTVARAAAAGVDLHAALVAHDISRALSAAEDIVVTGPTGTNVNDLVVIVVLPMAP